MFAPDSVLVDATQATETITGDVGDASGVNVALASLAADGAACLLCVCVCVCEWQATYPHSPRLCTGLQVHSPASASVVLTCCLLSS